MISPYVLTYPLPKKPMDNPYPQTSTFQPKYMGSLNVNRKDLKRILIDKKAQAFYDQMIAAFKNREFINEQAQRSCAR